MSTVLRIGFFENFRDRDSVLFAGDGEAMALLAQAFQALASGEAEQFRLDALPFVRAYGRVSVQAERCPRSSGFRYAARGPGGPGGPDAARCFIWRLSAEDWEDAALRVAALREGGPGHQDLHYLGVLDDVQPVVAAGEYGEDWWRRHG